MSHSRQIVNDLTALQEDVLTLLQHHVYSGMEVIAALDACSGRHYNVANTYTLRKHMVRAGLLTTQRRPGRQRQYFTTTPLGTERLTACRQRCRALALWGLPTSAAQCQVALTEKRTRQVALTSERELIPNDSDVLPDKAFHMGLI